MRRERTSRPFSSVPRRDSLSGRWDRLLIVICSGSRGAITRAAEASRWMRARKMKAAKAIRLRMTTRTPSRHSFRPRACRNSPRLRGAALATVFGSETISASPRLARAIQTDARVNPAVDEVRQEGADEHHQADEQRDAHHDGVVALSGGVHGEATHPRIGEDILGDRGTADQPRYDNADDRHNRNERIA